MIEELDKRNKITQQTEVMKSTLYTRLIYGGCHFHLLCAVGNLFVNNKAHYTKLAILLVLQLRRLPLKYYQDEFNIQHMKELVNKNGERK